MPTPVSTRAVIKRINRKLAPDGEQLRTCRGGPWEHELGRYFVTNAQNAIASTHVALEGYARGLGALRTDETIGEASCR